MTGAVATPGAKPYPFWRKLAYGAGDFGQNYSWAFVSSFVLFYATTVVGLSAAVVGTLMLVARLLDGITDVAVGGLIDKTQTRMGKARPWLFWSTFPLAISQILLFNMPAGLNGVARYAYFFVVFLLLASFFYTASTLAYGTLVALVTTDAKTRVALGSIRAIFSLAAVLIMSATTPGLVSRFGGGQLGWGIVGTIYACILVVFTLITVFGVKELSPEELGHSTHSEETSGMFWKRLAILVRNRFFLLLLLTMLFTYIANGIAQAVGIYYATYVLGDASLLGLTTLVSLLPMIAVLPLIPRLSARYSIRALLIAGAGLGIVGYVIALASNAFLPILLVGFAISAVGQAPFAGAIYALVAATAENIQLTRGVRSEGTVFACVTVGIKIGTGIGVAAAGWMLTLGGFDGAAAVQPSGALVAMTTLNFGVPLVLTILKLPVLWMLTVERVNAKLAPERAPSDEGLSKEELATPTATNTTGEY